MTMYVLPIAYCRNEYSMNIWPMAYCRNEYSYVYIAHCPLSTAGMTIAMYILPRMTIAMFILPIAYCGNDYSCVYIYIYIACSLLIPLDALDTFIIVYTWMDWFRSLLDGLVTECMDGWAESDALTDVCIYAWIGLDPYWMDWSVCMDGWNSNHTVIIKCTRCFHKCIYIYIYTYTHICMD